MNYWDYVVAFVAAGLVVSYFLFWRKSPAKPLYVQSPVDHMENSLRSATEAVRVAAEVHDNSDGNLPGHIQEATVALANGAKKALEVVHASAEVAKRNMEDGHGD
jgi:hypothetical protein